MTKNNISKSISISHNGLSVEATLNTPLLTLATGIILVLIGLSGLSKAK